MVSPASTRPEPSASTGVPACLSSVRVATVLVGVLVVSVVGGTEVPSGPVAVAVAVLSTVPASTSAWVITYSAVQVVEDPGTRVAVGQATGPALGSSTMTSVRV